MAPELVSADKPPAANSRQASGGTLLSPLTAKRRPASLIRSLKECCAASFTPHHTPVTGCSISWPVLARRMLSHNSSVVVSCWSMTAAIRFRSCSSGSAPMRGEQAVNTYHLPSNVRHPTCRRHRAAAADASSLASHCSLPFTLTCLDQHDLHS